MALGSTAVPAVTKEALRSKMITSLFGRRAGLDAKGYEVGENDTRVAIDNIGTTVNSSLSENGVSLFSSTVASSGIYTLFGGVSSVYKTLTQISSSTLGFVVQFGANANIVTTAGTSFNQITFQGVGHTASLQAVSDSTGAGAVWISASPASPGLSFSTY